MSNIKSKMIYSGCGCEVIEHFPDFCPDCRITALEATIKKVEAVGFEVHDSWGASEEFKDGWRECRAQVEEALGESK